MDITIISESLDTEFLNCADIMSFALLDSRLLSDEEPNCSEVTPEAVNITGKIIAKSRIQVAIIVNFRFVMNLPNLSNELTLF